MLMGSVGSHGTSMGSLGGYGGDSGGLEHQSQDSVMMDYGGMQPMSGYGAMMQPDIQRGGGGGGGGGYGAASQEYAYRLLPASNQNEQNNEQYASDSNEHPSAIMSGDNMQTTNGVRQDSSDQQNSVPQHNVPEEVDYSRERAALAPLPGQQLEATFQLPDRRK